MLEDERTRPCCLEESERTNVLLDRMDLMPWHVADLEELIGSPVKSSPRRRTHKKPRTRMEKSLERPAGQQSKPPSLRASLQRSKSYALGQGSVESRQKPARRKPSDKRVPTSSARLNEPKENSSPTTGSALHRKKPSRSTLCRSKSASLTEYVQPKKAKAATNENLVDNQERPGQQRSVPPASCRRGLQRWGSIGSGLGKVSLKTSFEGNTTKTSSISASGRNLLRRTKSLRGFSSSGSMVFGIGRGKR